MENTVDKVKEMVIIPAMIISSLHNHDCSQGAVLLRVRYSPHPPTCSEPGPVPCTNDCIVVCQCPSGTVLDEVQKKCVKSDRFAW